MKSRYIPILMALYAILAYFFTVYIPGSQLFCEYIPNFLAVLTTIVYTVFLTKLSMVKNRTRAQSVFGLILLYFMIRNVGQIFDLVSVGWTKGVFVVGGDLKYVLSVVLSMMFVLYPLNLVVPLRVRTIKQYLVILSPLFVSILLGMFVQIFFDVEGLVSKISAILCALYPLALLFYVLYNNKVFDKQFKDNFSNKESFDIAFATNFVLGYIILVLSYCVCVQLHQSGSALIQELSEVHNSIFPIFMILSFPYVMRFKEIMADEPVEDIEAISEQQEDIAESADDELLDGTASSFDTRIEEYKTKIEEWMTREKPYLNPDFCLHDISKVLPLNRSYISRVINEGYGVSFYNFVVSHRIDESIRLLSEESEMTIAQIAEKSGFSSPSVYARTFKNLKGKTPAAYRKEVLYK